MPLLAAAANSDSNPDKIIDTIPVLNGETLVPDMIPSESAGDISTKISTYTVRSGDTISGVASMFKVSINTVLWANNLTSKSVLQAGQTLVILPVTGIAHTVGKGENVSTIAKKYRADAHEIYAYNDLSESSVLTIGQRLIIPSAEFIMTAPVVVNGRIKVAPYEPLIGDVKNLPSYPGYFACPVLGGRLTQSLHGRNAIDLAAPIGTPIRASADGTAIISRGGGSWSGGYGNFVVISHNNGSQTLYAHMSKTAVLAGALVRKGQVIGYIGMTGLTTGPHIHFEIRGAQNPFTSQSCD
jgi:LysM repeat protein